MQQPLLWTGGAEVPLQGPGRVPAGQLPGCVPWLPPCDLEAGYLKTLIEGTRTVHCKHWTVQALDSDDYEVGKISCITSYYLVDLPVPGGRVEGDIGGSDREADSLFVFICVDICPLFVLIARMVYLFTQLCYAISCSSPLHPGGHVSC